MGPSLLMVMTLELMFLFVLLRTGAQQLLIVLRLQMRTAILYTCIYIQYGKTLVCVCACVCTHVMCVGISRFVFCPLFSSLVLLSVHCIVLPLLSKQHTHTYTHNALERRSHHFSSVKTHSPLLR